MTWLPIYTKAMPMANYFWLVKRGFETMKKRGLRWHMKMARWRLVWTFRKLVYVYSKKWSLIHGTWICAEKTLDPLITRCTFSNRAKLNNHPLSRYYSSIRSLLLFAAAVDAANATAISTAKKWGAATSNGKKLSLKWTEADYFYYQEHYFTCNIACVGRYLRWHSRKCWLKCIFESVWWTEGHWLQPSQLRRQTTLIWSDALLGPALQRTRTSVWSLPSSTWQSQ